MIGECGAAWDWSCYSPMDSRAGSPKILTATTHRSLAQWTVLSPARDRERAGRGCPSHPHVIALSGTPPDFVVAWPDMSALELIRRGLTRRRELASDFTPVTRHLGGCRCQTSQRSSRKRLRYVPPTPHLCYPASRSCSYLTPIETMH